MSKILVPLRSMEDWRSLLAERKHWKTGYSAHATAHRWLDANDGLPPEIADLLGPDARLLLAIPEHQVPLPGRGRASQCDVFALVRAGDSTLAVAIEGKVDEPFGPTIGEWLASASEGRSNRLRAICDMLGVACPPPPDLRYQLFHRTAAAVIEARRFKADAAAMIVHSFSLERRWFEDFERFLGLLNISAEPGAAQRVTLPDGMTLILGWATGQPQHLGG